MSRLALSLIVAASAGAAVAGEPHPAMAVLKQHCLSCHSHAAGKSKGGLVLDARESVLKGGDSGPAVNADKPADSLLLQAIDHIGDASPMPPKGKLPDAERATLRAWVLAGTPFPNATAVATTKKSTARPPGKITDEDRRWWAFQPPRAASPPRTIDQFVGDKLTSAGLAFAPEAERRTQIRRLTYDLTGLPPTPAEVEAFVADQSPDAYGKLVDRLLASPRYGERWARLWMDWVRYAESDGYRIDDYRPTAWRYRDYVIRSLNADKPYDRFVREQLAGDELDGDNPDAQAATGFLRLGIYEYNNRDVRGQYDTMLNDVTDTVGDVFLGLGMGCARCHDHKFDPILQKDYYKLQAFFAPAAAHDDLPLASAAQVAEYQRKLAAWEAETTDLRAKIEAIEAPVRAKAREDGIKRFPEDIQEMLQKPEAERTPLEAQLGALAFRQVLFEYGRMDRKLKDDDKKKLIELRKQLAAHDALKPAPLPAAMTVRDVGKAAPPTVMPKKNTAVEPGYPVVMGDPPLTIPDLGGRPTTGRRAALATWLTEPGNPLTARVIVNRVWQAHFGQGLVTTTSDFGTLGDKPSHPELLDDLTARFVRDGWSLKKLHRELVTSRAYRQASTVADATAALKVDPENRLLWRMPTRRLDAEQIRDSILAATGQLDLTAGGPSVEVAQPRRTVYTKAFRNSRDAILDVFDAPDGIASNPQRNVTTTPTQALLLINGPFLLGQAQAFAASLKKAGGTDDAMLGEAYRRLFGRPPTAEESRRLLGFVSRQGKLSPTTVDAAGSLAFGKLPFRDGKALNVAGDGSTPRVAVGPSDRLPDGDFTVEAFVLLRSLFEDASVRPIASSWDGDKRHAGWTFGVTSKKSAYKPETVVLTLSGQGRDGEPHYEAVFSGLHVDLNKPYFLAAAVTLAKGNVPGKVRFSLKDLSNDDEQMIAATQPHQLAGLPHRTLPMMIGEQPTKAPKLWDGLIDDVRLSSGVMPTAKLLFTSDGVTEQTAGYWQFEPQPGPLADTSPHGLTLAAGRATSAAAVKNTGAWADLCHVLLNCNEFLYVD